MQKKAFLFAAAALLALGARPAEAQRRVRCESRDYRQQLCRVETSGGVRLARQLGDASCRQGRTWGTTRSGIWVSNGCRADFEVGRGGGGILDAWRRGTNNGDWNRGRNDDWNRGRDDDWNRGSFGNASARCRAAVASRLGTRASSVNTWNQRQSGSSLELGWRAGRENGTCRVERNGRVRVSVDRDRYRDGDWDRNRGRDRDNDRDRGHDRDRDRDGRRG